VAETTSTQPIVVEPEGSAAVAPTLPNAPSQEQKPPTIIVPEVGAVGKHEREQPSSGPSAGAFDPNPSAAADDKDSQGKSKRAKSEAP
jgi:hypothetical protein